MDKGYTFNLRREPRLESKFDAFAYQEEAVEFVAYRDYSAIFHEQGLGKTKIAIDVCLRWLNEKVIDTAFIVTKKSLVANWQREFDLHTYLKPQTLSSDSRKNYYIFTTPSRVVVSHFEVARKEEKRLSLWLRSRRVAAILDESAKIKNPDASLTKVFHRLGPLFSRRIIMTGTPVANRPFDVWSQIFFLDQGATLGADFAEFKRQTDLSKDIATNGTGIESYGQRLTGISRKLEAISVRETKDGGRISLPTKEFETIGCTWEPAQHEMYLQVKEDLRAIIIRDGNLIEEDQESILKRLLRLVQIASNPQLIDSSYTSEPGKYPTLYDLITDITGRAEKAIVWTNFTKNVDLLAKLLAPFGALRVHGKLNMDRRNEAVKWFLNNENDRVLIATPGAAKEGLTLTVANHVIFYDRSYSLDDYLQAQDRIHRISQKKKCFVHNLVMQDSVDEWIDVLLEEKRLAAQVTQGDLDTSQYVAKATFSFVDVLDRILKSSKD